MSTAPPFAECRVLVQHVPHPGRAALHDAEVHAVHEAEVQEDHAAVVAEPDVAITVAVAITSITSITIRIICGLKEKPSTIKQYGSD